MAKITHGHNVGGKQSKELQAWHNMRRRCNDPKNKSYDRYGGRGIKCEYESFEQFFGDVGFAPSPEHSLDRSDSNGNYGVGKCRWATATEQANNQRSNIAVGDLPTVAEAARENERSYPALYWRLDHGWEVDKALETPEKKKRYIEWNGESKTVDQWAKATGLHRNTIQYRLKQGWTTEQVLSAKENTRCNATGVFKKRFSNE